MMGGMGMGMPWSHGMIPSGMHGMGMMGGMPYGGANGMGGGMGMGGMMGMMGGGPFGTMTGLQPTYNPMIAMHHAALMGGGQQQFHPPGLVHGNGASYPEPDFDRYHSVIPAP